MDILEQIRDDHEQARQIMEKMAHTGDRAPKNKREQFSKLKSILNPHIKAEEEVFYPILLESEDAREHMLEALEEHHIADIMLNELQDNIDSPDQERWQAKFSVFRTILEYHMDEEEGETFDYAQDLLSDDQLQDLGETFVEQKQSVEAALAR